MSHSIKDFNKLYPFSKDPRDRQLSLEHHTYWEEDNRVEERFQWGAQILDLCGMSIEEYMKNPIVEVLEEILSAVTPTPPPPPAVTVDFYYASINCQTSGLEIDMPMFTKATAELETPVDVAFVLGDPDAQDIEYIKKNGWSDESKKRVMEQKANTYYLIIPKEYDNNDQLVLVDEEGLILQNPEITHDVSMIGCPLGYVLIGIKDIDNFNTMWPIRQHVKTKYKISFLKKEE